VLNYSILHMTKKLRKTICRTNEDHVGSARRRKRKEAIKRFALSLTHRWAEARWKQGVSQQTVFSPSCTKCAYGFESYDDDSLSITAFKRCKA
jgi:hypothetical protein